MASRRRETDRASRRAGDQNGARERVRDEIARNRREAARQQERIEQTPNHARLLGTDELRQAHGEARLRGAIAEPERTEVKLEVGEQRNEREHHVVEAREHRVQKARHDLRLPEAKAPNEHLELREPAAHRRIREGVARVLPDLHDVKAANAPVRPDAELHRHAGEPGIVAQQIREPPVGLALLHAERELAFSAEPR